MNKSHCFLVPLLLLSLLFACKAPAEKKDSPHVDPVLTFSLMSAWDSLLFAHEVKGAILILDSTNQTFYGNDSVYSSKAYLPASTFKIPNSLVGLASGVLKDKHTILPWDGEDRFMDSWEEDLTLDEAFKRSCLPCYQWMTREIGFAKVKELVEALEYGDMEVNEETYDSFWVVGSSKITPFEQIEFLQRIFSGELPHKPAHIETLKEIMIMDSKPGYVLRAKTGWSIEGDYNSGWYVGRLEKGKQVLYFATHLAPVDQEETSHFGKARIDVSLKALEMLMVH